MRSGIRLLIGVAVAAVTVFGVPGVVSAADTWTVQSVSLPSGGTTGLLTGVSCTSPASCEAVMFWDQGQPEAEVRVVVGRARLHDHPEIVGRLRVPARVELGPGQGLPHAAGGGLGRRSALEHLGRGGRAAAAEKFHATPIPGVHIFLRKGLAREVFLRTGITARA